MYRHDETLDAMHASDDSVRALNLAGMVAYRLQDGTFVGVAFRYRRQPAPEVTHVSPCGGVVSAVLVADQDWRRLRRGKRATCNHTFRRTR